MDKLYCQTLNKIHVICQEIADAGLGKKTRLAMAVNLTTQILSATAGWLASSMRDALD